jgi:TolB-like protein
VIEQRVSFDAYVFELETARLWSGSREIRLTPKAAAVLKELVTQAGTPVSKNHLFASVWSGTAVSDDALISCIQELRRAFEDDARRPRVIETRHRLGYRFLAQLSTPPADRTADAAASIDGTAIAVLPFADMSPGRDQEYFCDGLVEELINALTQVDGLRVASRTASSQFRGGTDVDDLGRRLRVNALLEGSVRTWDNRLRITVQLIDAATGYHRWSQCFDRTRDDILAIQNDIAKSVAASLQPGLFRPAQPAQPPLRRVS